MALVLIALFTAVAGCSQSGPPSTHTLSSSFKTLAERKAFFKQYVKVACDYQTLDFDIQYQNNSRGMVPAPSEWDMRFVATIPVSQIDRWLNGFESVEQPPELDWLETLPTDVDLMSVSQWYVNVNNVIGVDHDKGIVVGRMLAI